jgi:hypothetical protein
MNVIHCTRGADPPINKGADTQNIAVEKIVYREALPVLEVEPRNIPI